MSAKAGPPKPVARRLMRVTHRTSYDYSALVTISHHAARLRPRTTPWQRVLSWDLAIEPEPGHRVDRVDYFGNTVTLLTIDEPHATLVVTSTATVNLTSPSPPDSDVPWEKAREIVGAAATPDDLEASQFTFPSENVPLLEELRGYAGESLKPGRGFLDAVRDLTSRIHADFAYEPGTTTIATPLHRVLRQRRGVCQDFAHLQISALRVLGLPARYVSGYILNLPPEGEEKPIGGDASHAWISVYLPGGGWFDFDPTNDSTPTLEHVTTAWGRDFSDVSPLKGVMIGGGSHQVGVDVEVAPLDEADAAA